MPTVTVRGFLNFRTTVDGTVIVFTPSPSPVQTPNSAILEQIDHTEEPPPVDPIRPTRLNRGPAQTYPTGLVTVLGGTVVQDGATTVYETKVIGTYISGKYAQILSSTIRVKPDQMVASPTIRPTMSYNQHHLVRPTKAIRDDRIEMEESMRSEDDTRANLRKIHPLRAKSQKLMENSKARHLNARLQLNPAKSRWAKLNKGEEDGNPEENDNRLNSKARRLKILGTRRFTLAPRQAPKVWSNYLQK